MQHKIQSELSEIESKGRYRKLRESSLIDLCSNDYLKLANHPKLKEAFIEGIQKFGCGSTASRLLRGHRSFIEEVELKFSEWVGSENSLFVANGFSANLGLIDLLADKKTIIFSDRLNHASILDGIRISGAEAKYYKHLDYENLESLLQKSNIDSMKIIVSETVFSMDGDLADISQLIQLKKKYNATLILDEAHALGVYGKLGEGLAGNLDRSELANIDFRIFTCGKSMGLEGAFIATSHLYKEYLVNRLRTFIFSTAPVPAVAYSVPTSIELVKSYSEKRSKLLELANYIRLELQKKGYETLKSESQIIPILCESETHAILLSIELEKKGFDIRAIRPPTVKKSRLRMSLNVSIDDSIANQFLNCLDNSLRQ